MTKCAVISPVLLLRQRLRLRGKRKNPALFSNQSQTFPSQAQGRSHIVSTVQCDHLTPLASKNSQNIVVNFGFLYEFDPTNIKQLPPRNPFRLQQSVNFFLTLLMFGPHFVILHSNSAPGYKWGLHWRGGHSFKAKTGIGSEISCADSLVHEQNGKYECSIMCTLTAGLGRISLLRRN